MVVSQNPRCRPGTTNSPPTSHQRTKKDSPVEGATIATATAKAVGSNGFQAATVNAASKESSGLRLDGSSSLRDDKQDGTSPRPAELDRIMAESKVWAHVAPLVPQTWTASITDGPETSAFIQAISLPLRSKMDMAWLTGIKNSHQRAYRAVMSVVFHVIGVEAHCKPCESRILEKRRNCKVLPPEAAGMRELQEVCGSQCVNCYFFHATRPCEFTAESATTIKQTPVPVPTPLLMRPMSHVERSFDPPPPAHLPAATRPYAPTYSSYKATKGEKPISQSPVPIPSLANRGPNNQSQSSRTSDESSVKPQTENVRRSRRVTVTNFQAAGSNSGGESDNRDGSVQQSAASSATPSEAALAPGGFVSGGSSTKESTAATSNLSSGDTSSSQLVARAFRLFGDISRLPVEEQAALWNQMQQMAGILQTGAATRSSTTMSTSPHPPAGPPAAADEWEIAPGRLIADDKHLMFSTSFLSREVVSVKAAQRLSPTQRVLNKSIAALDQLIVGQEEGWDCQCSVIRGMLKVKVGDVGARIGQGGVIVVEKECVITNVSHKEARIQMWWTKVYD